MRALVCGGRDFSDTAMAYGVLDRLRRQLGFDVVIEGDARGADRIAGYWARRARLDLLRFPVTPEDYATHGRYRAPKVRNQRMIDEGKPDVCIAFPGQGGTKDMTDRALAAGLRVLEVTPSGDVVEASPAGSAMG